METIALFQSNFFQNSLLIGQGLLVASIGLTFLRFAFGPHAHDRVLSFDMIYNLVMLLFISYAIRYQENYYFDIALMIALLGFVSTIALAKFLMRGEVIE